MKYSLDDNDKKTHKIATSYEEIIQTYLEGDSGTSILTSNETSIRLMKGEELKKVYKRLEDDGKEVPADIRGEIEIYVLNDGTDDVGRTTSTLTPKDVKDYMQKHKDDSVLRIANNSDPSLRDLAAITTIPEDIISATNSGITYLVKSTGGEKSPRWALHVRRPGLVPHVPHRCAGLTHKSAFRLWRFFRIYAQPFPGRLPAIAQLTFRSVLRPQYR